MGITRVQYRERQRLTAADLRLEQTYRLSMAGRHYLAPHDWGLIRGLQVEESERDHFQLGAGVAIDGYGRELLVPEAVDLLIDDFEPTQCWYVYLFYCEDPEQVPPGRVCKDTPAPRIRQRTAIQLSNTLLAVRPDQTDLSSARAAGTVPGAIPWPVLLASIGTGCATKADPKAPLIDHSSARYARHRASYLRSPSGNALMQLGLKALTDIYHFLVSTRDPKQFLQTRLGIDRDHTFHVWQPLVVSGAQGTAEVALVKNLKLNISMPMPAGLGRSLRIDGRVDPELRTLSASLVELGERPPGVPPQATAHTALKGKSASLSFHRLAKASVSLLDASKADSIAFAVGRRRARRGQKEDVAFSVQIERTGGLVAVDNKTILRPAAQLDADPLMREIFAVVTSAPTDVALKTELRISGGATDDSDASRRLSFGAQTPDGYVPSLSMDGRGRVGIWASKAPQPGSESSLLTVDGTVYLPPIGKNDPLLPDLVTLAYLSGLVQVGNITTNPTIEVKPGTGNPAAIYDLAVTRNTGAFTVKHTVELITGITSTADMSFRTVGTLNVPAADNTTTTTHITPPGLPPSSARQVQVQVLMLVDIAGKARVAISPLQTIQLP